MTEITESLKRNKALTGDEGMPPKPTPTTRVDPRMPETEMEIAEESLAFWRDRAQRLQAEGENYRKRQRRLADKRVAEASRDLLCEFLAIADDLHRALVADQTGAQELREGIQLTYHKLMRILGNHDVHPLPANGVPFDPERHEAVGGVAHQSVGAQPHIVYEVLQEGYQLGEELLRPARVVVTT